MNNDGSFSPFYRMTNQNVENVIFCHPHLIRVDSGPGLTCSAIIIYLRGLSSFCDAYQR